MLDLRIDVDRVVPSKALVKPPSPERVSECLTADCDVGNVLARRVPTGHIPRSDK
jgi:hypothetical protein